MNPDPEQLRAMLAKATRLPWQVSGVRRKPATLVTALNEFHAIGPDGDEVALVWFDLKTGLSFADAKLIVAAVNALPALLDEHEKMRAALDWFAKHESSITSDIYTAHSLRGDGASQFMREDDSEFRADLRSAFMRARAALANSTRQEDEDG